MLYNIYKNANVSQGSPSFFLHILCMFNVISTFHSALPQLTHADRLNRHRHLI